MTPGYKTTEFWLLLLAASITGAMGFLQTLDAPWAVLSVTVLSALYAVLRSALKAKDAGK